MAQSLSTSCPSLSEALSTAPAIQLPDGTLQHSSVPHPAPPFFRNAHVGHVNLDTFSPVNENGSFEFDRVLKTGKILRRVKHKHAFRASWKQAYLVLRPNLLSVYKDEEATRLRASITLSEVTAVAPVRSSRSSKQHVFGIFSPSKNYRFQASSEKEAQIWIESIRAETRVDEEEEAFLGKGGKPNATADTNRPRIYDSTDHSEVEHAGRASSPELGRHSGRLASIQDYSGNDITSYSEWSDGPASTYVKSKSSFQNLSASAPSSTPPPLPRDQNRVVDAATPRDPERVICNGYLQCLRIKGTVRQWKRLWVVLRPKSLSFYKDDQEYSAVRIIPMEQVIDAAEIDPVSRSKQNCIQIIAEEKSYRLCTEDEESLAKWLGSLKSVLVARKKKAA
ncbi:PH domain-containing protein [Aspergillus candidus]|uniref:PH domain protein n=1 Tax=Aspergillus candidus TaxID=41067 RepID=A0A2I2FN38_ASPCN|nr:PH domain protein [Aspergillus candidus]PLB42046.1 PH domain protein [Aspergillus candidus]